MFRVSSTSFQAFQGTRPGAGQGSRVSRLNNGSTATKSQTERSYCTREELASRPTPNTQQATSSSTTLNTQLYGQHPTASNTQHALRCSKGAERIFRPLKLAGTCWGFPFVWTTLRIGHWGREIESIYVYDQLSTVRP